jgi:hypothetical protein
MVESWMKQGRVDTSWQTRICEVFLLFKGEQWLDWKLQNGNQGTVIKPL